jgi:2-aminoadipate transaminase
VLAAKLQTLRQALAEQFGTAADSATPPGVSIWIKLPDNVDTVKLAQAALAAGVSLNPLMVDQQGIREVPAAPLASPIPSRDHLTGRRGAGRVCRREFGVPLRSANVDRV